MTRTFIDSGVLIAAARAQPVRSCVALSLLSEEDREFASSLFIQLEILPKAIYYQQQQQFSLWLCSTKFTVQAELVEACLILRQAQGERLVFQNENCFSNRLRRSFMSPFLQGLASGQRI